MDTDSNRVHSEPITEGRAFLKCNPGRPLKSDLMSLITQLTGTSYANDLMWVVDERLFESVHVQPTRRVVAAEQFALLYEQTVLFIMDSERYLSVSYHFLWPFRKH
jgi:hypothetical protein